MTILLTDMRCEYGKTENEQILTCVLRSLNQITLITFFLGISKVFMWLKNLFLDVDKE